MELVVCFCLLMKLIEHASAIFRNMLLQERLGSGVALVVEVIQQQGLPARVLDVFVEIRVVASVWLVLVGGVV